LPIAFPENGYIIEYWQRFINLPDANPIQKMDVSGCFLQEPEKSALAINIHSLADITFSA
jgi:hypothetical protein